MPWAVYSTFCMLDSITISSPIDPPAGIAARCVHAMMVFAFVRWSESQQSIVSVLLRIISDKPKKAPINPLVARRKTGLSCIIPLSRNSSIRYVVARIVSAIHAVDNMQTLLRLYLCMRYEQNKPKANTDTPGIPVHDAICVCDSSRTEDRISGIVGISIYIAAAMKNVEVVSFQKSVCIWRCFS